MWEDTANRNGPWARGRQRLGLDRVKRRILEPARRLAYAPAEACLEVFVGAGRSIDEGRPCAKVQRIELDVVS
jgi:hypothetical protein